MSRDQTMTITTETNGKVCSQGDRPSQTIWFGPTQVTWPAADKEFEGNVRDY